MSSATLSELLDALDNGARFLLPNARAARELRSAFDAQQRMRGLSVWEPPQVLSWSQWTSSQWSELIVAGGARRLLLNAAQEHSLWREILVEDAGSGLPGSADSLAELARSAWQLAASYNATHRLREFAMTHDSWIFAKWAGEFSKRCAAQGFLSAALLDAALLEHVQTGAVAAPDSLELVGFGELPPSQEALLAGLRECGTEVLERSLEAAAEGERLRASVVAANEHDELLFAARWVRGFLEGQHAKERGARVAVLVPSLGEERAELEDILRETLAPELQSIDADLSSTPWEFSGGVPLSSIAVVADALALARWADGALPLARVSSLLLSPYVGRNGADDEGRNASARFDAGRLRRTLLLRSEIEISSLLELAEDSPSDERALLGWLRSVQEFLRRANDRNRLRSFAEWMEFVRGLTQAANWPGDRALTATEFEATRAWESTLDLVSTLDFNGRRVTFASALQALVLQAQTTIFVPPMTGAAVQVMSVAEAEGSIFDAVVFLRVTDANWPVSERVNPLLPWALQRSLKMPGSDPALTAAKSRAFTDDLLRRSGSVLFTCAAEDGGVKLRPSPLLSEMGIERIAARRLVPPVLSIEPIAIENDVDDDELPALPSHEVAGGAAVLKLQAACGFLAFAELRLRATEPKSGDMGLDAGESGSLLHRTLQNVWKTVKTQEALKAMSWAERDWVLAGSIDEALPHRLQVRDEWDRAYLALLKERLRSLLQRWMEEELKRGPFSVLAVEQDQAVTVGPLTLKVRMDRVDKVGEGVFFVDYKTGYAADPKQWIGERPDDPQLPLYTLLPEAEELKGMAFAKVRTGRDMKWLGYQVEEGILPASPRSKPNVRNMASLVEEWRGTLMRLAEDFAAGKADVRPKSYEQNCTRCAQRLLCRLDPTTLLDAMEEEEVEDVDG
jgi:ATP-dependent helicase/nuclease subunit B